MLEDEIDGDLQALIDEAIAALESGAIDEILETHKDKLNDQIVETSKSNALQDVESRIVVGHHQRFKHSLSTKILMMHHKTK